MNRWTINLVLTLAGMGMVFTACKRWFTYDLRGRVVLVTGGSRGLGLALARALAQEGARLALCSRNPEALAEAKRVLGALGAEVFTQVCDVTDPAQVHALVQSVQTQLGPIEVLINNAGVISVGPAVATCLEDYEQLMQTNFWGPLYTTLAVLPQMRARKAGRIVNIASIGGKVSLPHLVPYSSSKFALVGLSQGLREELAQDGVVVTTVCPGVIQTGTTAQQIYRGQAEKEEAWFTWSSNSMLTGIPLEEAARQILQALKSGQAELVFALPVQVLERCHALFPELTIGLLSWVNRLLPKAEPSEVVERTPTGDKATV
ncbi:SDR family NAD(P)-dependent oxidoreductase [Anthocerotibacter panamensis]|uniref:SDR family NAD(P)-dependent oxidoreductase n=1 Tax=Anthocerotibacter panamensis TaxID=2857077 RepID=UPI001C4016A3|nr:SDR family oxidoreductase [Anthocerotibacter panamensis]